MNSQTSGRTSAEKKRSLLVDEAQELARDDAGEADGIAGRAKAADRQDGAGSDRRSRLRRVVHHAASASGSVGQRAVSVLERTGFARGGDDSQGIAVRDDPASVQHVNLVLGLDLVEQMRRPKDGEALLGDEPAHRRDDVGAGRAIESDRRLVEEEKARAMNERARDLDAPRLPAGQRANFFVDPLGKARSGDEGRDVRVYLRPGKPVQRSMIG